MSLYLGLMSGTSMDGIDAALLQIDSDRTMRVCAAAEREWPSALQQRLRRAAEDPGHTGLAEFGQLDTTVAIEFALAAEGLLRTAAVAPDTVRAIGSHGQTLLHQPRGATPFTLQIGDPNVIAERLGIDVVADFRRRDLAAGGEGAPLMPAFHAAAFGAAGRARALVNIGGIANVTRLHADGSVIGFDTGPGNCLMDAWARRHLQLAYDGAGRWAAGGTVLPGLLAQLLQDPYFSRPAPKSTGRDAFSDAWLERALADAGSAHAAPADVQATLAELTARSIAASLQGDPAAGPEQVFVCGGGAFNADLMARLARALPGARLDTTASCGIAPEHVEAAGFAWLAHRYLAGLPGNLPAVTGAGHAVPLGALYRGRLTAAAGWR
ncbi:MAG TPA: anhydro-N-acetylmuramic acid kinase [Steroidobacteraceae bacterium]|jgi:anhydro-N-acetylmuramic acid kinase|nr:anhydro-N-acetylmuramic acid kinase [Steroidobacteraceae bacterium]